MSSFEDDSTENINSKSIVQIMKVRSLFLCVVLFLAAMVFAGQTEPTVRGKKLIKLYGLDKPSTAYLKEHVAQIEKVALDGICIVVATDEPKIGDTSRKHGNYLWFTSNALSREDFVGAVRNLNETQFERLHFNFMHYAARGPNNPKWFDDRAWETVIANTRVAGWVVAQTPIVGITFDCEYDNGGIWNYARIASIASTKARSFDAYCAKARQRGRAWAEALCEAAPNVIICLSHGYWYASPKTAASGAQDAASLKETLADQVYAIYPAFLDGMIEGLGPRARVVDGCEHTYPYMVYDTFDGFRRWAHRESLKLTGVPELLEKRLTFAMAVWPGFRSDVGNMWNPQTPEQNFFTPTRLSHALHNAMAASDEFAWMWNGRDIWWPMSVPPRKFGEKIGWGVLEQYPEVYRQAVADCRAPKDLDWRPIPPDTETYPDAGKPPFAQKGYEVLADLPDEWWFKTEPGNVLYPFAQTYSGWTNNRRPNVNEADEGWRQLTVGQPWENQGVSYNGVAWYRLRFTPPDSVQGRRLWLTFGGVANEAHVFVAPRGMRFRSLGQNTTDGPFSIDATGAFVPGTEALITVRVINPAGPGGILSTVKLVGKKGERPYVAKPGRYAVLDLDFVAITDGRVPDTCGYGNDATLSRCEIADGPGGRKAIRLNGKNSSAATRRHASLNPWNGRRSWELWYSPGGEIPDSDIVYHILLAKHPAYSHGLYLSQSGRPRKIFFIQGTPSQSLSYDIDDPNAWYHAVGTCDGREMRLYINGELVGRRTAPIPPPINSAPVTIGGGATDANRCAPGLVAKVAVYNYALSESQVKTKYQTLTIEKAPRRDS